MTTEVTHLSRGKAETTLPFLPPETGVIEIRDTVESLADIAPPLTPWLSLQFEDHDLAGMPQPYRALYEERLSPFNEEHANEILNWLAVYGDLDLFLVFCKAGQSRSAAVARFIADIGFLRFDSIKGKHFNKHVYNTLMTAYGHRHPWRARWVRAVRCLKDVFGR
jgi:hypothetical protein